MSLITECFNKVNWIQNYVACPINEKEHDELTRNLENVQERLKTLGASVFSKPLEDQIISLYGKIDESLFRYELGRIQNEATILEASRKAGNRKIVSQTTALLQNHITAIWDRYRPSLEERRVIAHIEQQLQETDLSDEKVVEEALILIAEALSTNDEKRAAFVFNNLSPAEQKLLCSYLPQEERSDLLHEIEGATHNDKIFLRQR